jgi:dihydroorotase
VACTITAHHLALTVDDWAGQSWNYCKPVAKFPDDREALRQVIREGEAELLCENAEALAGLGHPRFFLGSDSAPHPSMKKSTSSPDHGCAAGIYTSPILLPLTAHLLESFGALDKLEGFVSKNGRAFYKKEIASIDGNNIVRLRKRKAGVTGTYSLKEEEVVSFWAGKELDWEIDNQG